MANLQPLDFVLQCLRLHTTLFYSTEFLFVFGRSEWAEVSSLHEFKGLPDSLTGPPVGVRLCSLPNTSSFMTDGLRQDDLAMFQHD